MSYPRTRSRCQRTSRPKRLHQNPPGQATGLNHVELTGILVATPQRDEDRGGKPLLLLSVAFHAPPEQVELQSEPACCEVEVPVALVKASEELRPGVAVRITGALSGGGGVRATAVGVGGLSRPSG